MKVLVTGSAGFIGSALCIKLLDLGDIVVGIDNHNDYYDPGLKERRLARHIEHSNYTHIRMDIEDEKAVESLFNVNRFDSVINLAAQAGVRYSIENPLAYVKTNILGFSHILEGCRYHRQYIKYRRLTMFRRNRSRHRHKAGHCQRRRRGCRFPRYLAIRRLLHRPRAVRPLRNQ